MPIDGVRDATAYARFKTQSKRVGSHQFDDTTSLAVPPADVCAGASNADSERDERGRPKSRLSQVRHSLADNAQVSRARETGISILNNPPISADDLFFEMEAHGLTETVDLFKPYAPSKGVLDR